MSDVLGPRIANDFRLTARPGPGRTASRSHRSRRSSGLEAREQVIGPRPPGRRIPTTTLGLIETRDLLVPGREGIRILESRDHLDGFEQMRLRLRPFAALREH